MPTIVLYLFCMPVERIMDGPASEPGSQFPEQGPVSFAAIYSAHALQWHGLIVTAAAVPWLSVDACCLIVPALPVGWKP